MEQTLKIKNLITGSYTINAYESVQSSYIDTFKIYATYSSNEEYIFWSNSFLTSYINKSRPRHEFDIIIDFNNRITIPAYSPITKLAPKILKYYIF